MDLYAILLFLLLAVTLYYTFNNDKSLFLFILLLVASYFYYAMQADKIRTELKSALADKLQNSNSLSDMFKKRK
jgi:hypothetical protein